MDITSDYFSVRGKTAQEALDKLKDLPSDYLAKMIVNNRLNEFVSQYSNRGDDEGGGKRVPYVGWYWRATNFIELKIPIGDCGEFIGVMENNKWDYPERMLTEDEAQAVLNIVWEAKVLSEEGGCVSEIESRTKAKLDELFPLFQTFKITK